MNDYKTLNILWTNDNVLTAEKMVFMYALVAKRRNLWDEVRIIIWGATTKLVAESTLIQELIEEAILEGIDVSACRSCADQLGVTEVLEGLDIDVLYQAEPFTQILKDDEKLITI